MFLLNYFNKSAGAIQWKMGILIPTTDVGTISYPYAKKRTSVHTSNTYKKCTFALQHSK